MRKRYFMITVDTEGDNIWEYKAQRKKLLIPQTKNALYISKFQQLCEKYQFYTTYFVDYEMAQSTAFMELGREIIKKNSGEIGMHMHAFSTPPFYELSDLRGKGLAFAGEYPQNVLYQKMEYMTKMLQDTFQIRISSHRGGRWYLDNRILKILDRLGYWVDCTVTPGVSWKSTKGQTGNSHGSDYSTYKSKVYKIKNTNLWELPVTIRNKVILKYKTKNFIQQQKVWLRPNGVNLKDMIWLVDNSLGKTQNYLEFMIHSSELMPGANPTFKTNKEIDRLFQQMDDLFFYIKEKGYEGITCSNYVTRGFIYGK